MQPSKFTEIKASLCDKLLPDCSKQLMLCKKEADLYEKVTSTLEALNKVLPADMQFFRKPPDSPPVPRHDLL